MIPDNLSISRWHEVMILDNLFISRWHEVKVLPGVQRLIKHLHATGTLLAIATSTSRSSFQRKMATHTALQDFFPVVICGDEVKHGKPAPDGFLAAARALGVDPGSCLVIEDAPSGIQVLQSLFLHCA